MRAARGVLCLAAGAAAAPPERIDDFELSVPDSTCPGIDTFTLKGSIVIHTLSPTESLETYPNFTVSWSGNGKTITSRGPASLRITYSDAAHTEIVRTEVHGLLVAVTLPGHGAVWLETGYLVFSGTFFGAPIIVRHGPDGFRSEEDYEAFCTYFED
jgi:hypothetical protein